MTYEATIASASRYSALRRDIGLRSCQLGKTAEIRPSLEPGCYHVDVRDEDVTLGTTEPVDPEFLSLALSRLGFPPLTAEWEEFPVSVRLPRSR